MNTFIVSDIHGNYGALWSLLNQEGLVDDTEERTPLGKATQIVSIGDLLNAVLVDVTGDELCASVADKWFDKLIIGNHEWPYLYPTAVFNGYYAHPPLRMLYNMWRREGFVVPAMVVGDTLVTHAGWAFKTYEHAHDTYAAIMRAWDNYDPNEGDPILDGIGPRRGGRHFYGGILWSDWHEPKHKGFRQVVGHTPTPDGPIFYERQDGTWTLLIDTGCKGGGVPSGVWLDEEGQIIATAKLGQNDDPEPEDDSEFEIEFELEEV